MKFTCMKETLLEGINIVSRAVSAKTSMQILECILIDVNEDGFKLTANDLEMGIKTKNLEATVIETGKVCIKAKLLIDIIKHLPEGMVSVKTDENFVTQIKAGKSEFKLLGQDSYEYPELPVVEKNNRYEIFSLDLKNMIRQTIFTVSFDESKITFTGEYLDIKSDELNIVAVDGFRISCRNSKLFYSSGDTGVIVPYKAMNEIGKIISAEPNEKINFYITDKHILFEDENCILVSRLIEGDFMNYEQVFTDDFNTKITADRDNFISCLERSLLVNSDVKKNPIKIKIDKDLMAISSATEIGTAYDELEVDLEGNNIEISFNPRYLIDALKVIDEDHVCVYFTTTLSPCKLQGKDSIDHKYLVLPLRSRN